MFLWAGRRGLEGVDPGLVDPQDEPGNALVRSVIESSTKVVLTRPTLAGAIQANISRESPPPRMSRK